MQKYIHYCWFGGKPLSKLTEKCLKSWEKYLPDFEIKRWDESNCDINECPFVKEAYENKKWAFVADYFRTKALKEFGGIYFDTDMEVIKDIKPLLEDKTILGLEDTGNVAVGFWYEKQKDGLLPTKLLQKYQTFKNFPISNMNQISIPLLLTEILSDYQVKKNAQVIQRLSNDIVIYPREYFYPLSMDHRHNIFTDNTCMIHYYDATWLSKKQKLELFLVRKIGQKNTQNLEWLGQKAKHVTLKIARYPLYPLVLYRRSQKKKLLITADYQESIASTINTIKKLKNKEYLTFYNPDWIGVSNATLELFTNVVPCQEIYTKRDVKLIGDAILESNPKQIIFSAFAIGWKDLAIYLKKQNLNLKIKTFWHGSHSQIHDEYGWQRNLEIINLHRKKIIDVMGTCKKSLVEFYQKQGFKTAFITNKVELNIKPNKKSKSKEIIIGLYAAKCNDWRKNMYSQIAAASLIDNAVIDMVPLNEEAIAFAKSLNVKIQGINHSLKREDLLKHMSEVDIVSYVTLSECSPMLPLESMELGIPCVCGNNHHYFLNSELENFVIVKNEDNPLAIKEQILKCLANKEQVIKLYQEFRQNNLQNSNQDVKKFLEM